KTGQQKIAALTSELAAVVGPVQERLALSPAAEKIGRFAMPPDLLHVPTHGFPAFDLTAVFFRHPPAQIIAAIPLEPAARVIGVNPTLGAPFRQRLACSYPEEIERAVAAAAGRELGAYKPAVGKFLAAVGQVLAAEYAEAKHVPRREIGIKLRIEV